MGVIESVRSVGTRVLPVPMDEQGMDLDALEQLLAREQTRFLAIQPRSHNPTGIDLAPARRTRLLELARRHGFFIVEDGIYGDLRFDGEDPGTLRSESHGHVIYVDSLSKTIGGGSGSAGSPRAAPSATGSSSRSARTTCTARVLPRAPRRADPSTCRSTSPS